MNNAQITVRGVDPILKQRIVKLARLKSMSINDFVLDTLRAKVSPSTPQKIVDWRRYSGTIDKKGINQAVLDDFESVSESMWIRCNDRC